jgi:hypothetical protein
MSHQLSGFRQSLLMVLSRALEAAFDHFEHHLATRSKLKHRSQSHMPVCSVNVENEHRLSV